MNSRENTDPPPHIRRRPTLHDVAAASGASVKTVSRVVNREGGVSPELAERVKAAIARLGYRRDDRARQLRSGSSTTRTIGLVLNDVANPFFASLFRGVEEVASSTGYILLSASSDGVAERQDEIISTFISRRVDGLIVVPVGGDMNLLADEVRLGTPVVFVDLMPSEVIGDVVVSDHRGGAYRATKHLIDHGHTRVAFLGDNPDFYSAGERLKAYRAAVEEAGLQFDPDLVRHAVGSPEAAASATRELLSLSDPPSALFAAQNFVSIGVVRALRQLGLSHQIAVVGFDDVEFADMLEPALSVAPQNPHELGRKAAELLFGRLDGYSAPPEIVVLPIELIERGSGEIAPPRGSGTTNLASGVPQRRIQRSGTPDCS